MTVTTLLGSNEEEVRRVEKRLREAGMEAGLAAILADEISKDYDTIIDTTGSYTYVGSAVAGTQRDVAGWQVIRISSDGTIAYADGDANFDNTATDMSSLTFS